MRTSEVRKASTKETPPREKASTKETSPRGRASTKRSSSADAPAASPKKGGPKVSYKVSPSQQAAAARAVSGRPTTSIDNVPEAVVNNLRRNGVNLHSIETTPDTGGPGHRAKQRKPVQINISVNLYRQLKNMSLIHGVSITDQITEALRHIGYVV